MSQNELPPHGPLLDLTTSIVSNYVNNNQVPADQVPAFISSVHKTLTQLSPEVSTQDNQDPAAQLTSGTAAADGATATQAPEAPEASDSGPARPTHQPPVKPRNSVRKNEVVCLECGTSFKTLKRHLRAEHGLEESDYKTRWDLPRDMKLVAKSYSEERSKRAREIGLGQQRAQSKRSQGKRSETKRAA